MLEIVASILSVFFLFLLVYIVNSGRPSARESFIETNASVDSDQQGGAITSEAA